MRTPASNSRSWRSRWAATSPAWWREAKSAGPGASAKSFDAGPGVVAAGADDRHVEDGDLDLVVGSADVVAVPAQDGRLVADRVEVGAHVAGVGPASGDAQRTPLAAAAHDQRQRADRPRVARGLGQRDPLAVVRLGAGRPEGPQRLGGDGEVVEALCRGRERQAVRRVLAAPPPGTQTAEGPAAGEHVQCRGRLGDDARRAEGGRRAERPELEVGAQRRQRSERHPRLGDRVPRPSRPAGSGSGGPSGPRPRNPRPPPRGRCRAASRAGPHPTGTARPGGSPAARRPPLLRPGLTRRGWAEARSRTRRGRPSPPPRAPHRCRASGEAVRRARRLGPAGPGRRSALGTAPGECRTRRPPAGARTREPAPPTTPASPGPGRGCRPPPSGRAGRVPRRSGRAAGTRPRTRRDRRCRCPPRRAARPRTPPRRRGSGPRPRSTSRSRPRRPAAPEPGREPAHRQCDTGVDSTYPIRRGGRP